MPTNPTLCPTCKRRPSERVACDSIGNPTVVRHCPDPTHDMADRAPELEARVVELEHERDEARSILVGTAERLNTALRESGCLGMIGDPYRSMAIRDGIVSLYVRGARWRASLAAAKDGLEAATDRETALRARVAELEAHDAETGRLLVEARDMIVARGMHSETCGVWGGSTCSCGRAALLARIDAATGGKDSDG